MEIVVEVNLSKIDEPARDLLCDMCNTAIWDEFHKEKNFYAILWKNKQDIFLEKYICPDCKDSIYGKKKTILLLEELSLDIQEAIKENLNRSFYGIISSFDGEFLDIF